MEAFLQSRSLKHTVKLNRLVDACW